MQFELIEKMGMNYEIESECETAYRKNNRVIDAMYNNDFISSNTQRILKRKNLELLDDFKERHKVDIILFNIDDYTPEQIKDIYWNFINQSANRDYFLQGLKELKVDVQIFN